MVQVIHLVQSFRLVQAPRLEQVARQMQFPRLVQTTVLKYKTLVQIVRYAYHIWSSITHDRLQQLPRLKPMVQQVRT